MADEKHRDSESGKAHAIEGNLMASTFESVVEGNAVDHSITPEEDRRILRKLDLWYVRFLKCLWLPRGT